MLNNRGFDIWADSYDKTVTESYDSDRYPFAGYKQLMNIIYNEVCSNEKANVLDIGFGTGFLTSKLYEAGHSITGVDFSKEMIKIAGEKMPKADLIKWDFSLGLPNTVKEKKYDYIICTYAIHHLDLKQKISFVQEAIGILKDMGKLIIGDVAFENKEELEKCRAENSQDWDEDEDYIAYDELIGGYGKKDASEFIKIGNCAGIVVFTNK